MAVKMISTLNPDQQQVGGDLRQTFQNQAAAGPRGWQYTGQLDAPMGQGEQGVIDNNARMNAIAGNTFGQIGTYDPNKTNEDFNKYIQQPSLQNWQANEAPYLREQLSGFSSEQGNVLNRGLQTLNNNLSQQRMGYHQQAQVNALNALSGANTYNQGSMAIQSVPREIQQAGLDRHYQNFVQGNQAYQNSVNQMLGYLGIQTQAAVQKPSAFQQILGGVGAAANVIGSVAPMFAGLPPIPSIGSGSGGNYAPAGAPDAGTQLPDYSNLKLPTGY